MRKSPPQRWRKIEAPLVVELKASSNSSSAPSTLLHRAAQVMRLQYTAGRKCSQYIDKQKKKNIYIYAWYHSHSKLLYPFHLDKNPKNIFHFTIALPTLARYGLSYLKHYPESLSVQYLNKAIGKSTKLQGSGRVVPR